MKYNEKYLLEAAQHFEDQAAGIVFMCAFRYGAIGLLIGLGAGFGLAASAPADVAPAGVAVAAVVALAIGVIAGIWRGKNLAFWLRVQAQKILALVQIEHSTHKVELVANEK